MGSLISLLSRSLVRLLEWVVIAGMAALVLDVLWGVFSRYVLGAQSQWTEPMATTLLVWLALLGGALAYGDKGHLGVDVMISRLDHRARRLARIMAQSLVLGFAGLVMVYGGWELVSERLARGQLVPGLGVRRGLVYMAVPIAGLFICLFAVQQLGQAIRGAEEKDRADGS